MKLSTLDKLKRDCAIRDIKDYFDGIITKKELCDYLSRDLNIYAFTFWNFMGLIWSIAIILIMLFIIL